MTADKINYGLRMTKDTNDYITSEAKNLGMTKSAFIHFLIAMYRKETDDSQQIKLSNQQMYQAVKAQIEKEQNF